MILIVDSGSTKTDWIALDNNGNELFSTQTLGLNPQMLSNEILNERIKNNFDIYKNRKVVEKLFFTELDVVLNQHKIGFLRCLGLSSQKVNLILKRIHMLLFFQQLMKASHLLLIL
ncbi:MAG: hypothetical protein CM15mP102_16670 [Flavobacteriales bacterium]|nr:MAG: hypothetical protein CM15mP102_16670 [Flavobacteriales bacterium]